MNKVFKYTKKDDGFVTVQSNNLRKLISIEDYNIEDLLFANRLAYLIFRKFKTKSTFDLFFKYIKIL